VTERAAKDISVWRATPVEYIEAGPNTFVVGLEYEGAGRASGVTTGMRTWDVIELAEAGLIRLDRQFFDRNEARAAAGLEPEND
jgi:hypothetical protein